MARLRFRVIALMGVENGYRLVALDLDTGEVVGKVSWREVDGVCHPYEWKVSPSRRGQGLGTRIADIASTYMQNRYGDPADGGIEIAIDPNTDQRASQALVNRQWNKGRLRPSIVDDVADVAVDE